MYYLFAGDHYYPSGGAKDFLGAFPSVEAAQAEAKERSSDWWHVTNMAMQIVASGYGE